MTFFLGFVTGIVVLFVIILVFAFGVVVGNKA